MGKKQSHALSKADARAETDFLRALAGYEQRSLMASAHRTRSRIVIIERDGEGRVLHSTERLEETEYLDLQGHFTD